MPTHDADTPPTPTDPKPEDTFALIGNETRVKIIQLLGNHAPNDAKAGLSFTELRNLFETDIDPGQLNYHLQELLEQFVQKIGDEYALSSQGLQVFLTLQKGVVDQLAGDMSVSAGFDCYYCQAPVEAAFTDGRAKIECPNCEYRYLTDYVAPAVATVSDEKEAFDHYSKIIHHKFLGYARGICQNCGRAAGSALIDAEKNPTMEATRSKVYVAKPCDHCGTLYYLHLGVDLLTDPAIVSFCYDHGVEVFATPYWEIEFAATDKHVTVLSTDPWKVALEVPYDDETLEVVVDGNLTVLERNYRDSATTGQGATADKPDVDEQSTAHAGSKVGRESTSKKQANLPAENGCLEELRRQRWPEGVRCPRCGSDAVVKIGSTSKDAQRYECQNCDSTFNDFTETIFAGHHLRLAELFHIISEVDETDVTEIARQLDRSYKPVLKFVHKVRDAQQGESEFDLVITPDIARQNLEEGQKDIGQ